jgi:hypothetical protein
VAPERLSDMFFDVAREPLYTKNGIYTRKDALLNANNGDLVGVVSDKYKVIQHRELLEPMMDMINEKQYTVNKIMSINNGSRIYLEVIIGGDIEVTRNEGQLDCMRPMATLVNSYDMSKPAGFIAGLFRLICKNGMYVGIRQIEFVKRHLGRNVFNLDFNEAVQGSIDLVTNRIAPKFRELVNKSVDANRLNLINENLPTRLVKEIGGEKAEQLNGKNEWEVYNMFTAQLTHEYKNYERAISIHKDLLKVFEI